MYAHSKKTNNCYADVYKLLYKTGCAVSGIKDAGKLFKKKVKDYNQNGTKM